ncbi:ATPase WRNIP1 [Heracleum sosnowskyi]|uniref:ATPase WRNIP1 n=1 Tax=Heracleum sosnowskyi TaxID=360622 RepID=A0AAD8H014_9APIA|nr:ATPase WRNIP1 [Heracleum sosnowskyi]
MEEEDAKQQQLLNMGFSQDLVSQALSATAGDSTLKATEWILSHTNKPPSSPPPLSSPFQPKINHFFTKPTQNPSQNPSLNPHKIQTKNTLFQEQEIISAPQKRIKIHPQMEPQKKYNHKPPLYERMRPRTIGEVVGQDHLLALNSLLRSAMVCKVIPSFVLWGPPGTGKTSIARALLDSSTSSCDVMYRFVSLSAVTAGVKDIRDVVEESRKLKLKGNKRTVLFVDEVHRFNKSQQDSFLPVIEDGSVVFVGATTENPSFHLITPLLSRCRVLNLSPLQPQHVCMLIRRAADDLERGVVQSLSNVGCGVLRVELSDEVVEFLGSNCDGDARVALNALENAAVMAAARVGDGGGSEKKENTGSFVLMVTLDDAKEALQCKHLAYDRAGDEHYNLISALHKSMRGSDANAAIYWLARMLEGGEEPLYIARRLVRFASEDVGLADPSAITQAVACYQACHFLGMPECDVNLSQCVAYLAMAPKSIAVYRALGAARKVIKESVGQNEGVPLHLRNAPTRLMKDFGYGKDYIYPPDNPSSTQTYLPPSLHGYKFLHWPDTAGAVDVSRRTD